MKNEYYWQPPAGSRVPPIIKVEQVTDDQWATMRRLCIANARDAEDEALLLGSFGLAES